MCISQRILVCYSLALLDPTSFASWPVPDCCGLEEFPWLYSGFFWLSTYAPSWFFSSSSLPQCSLLTCFLQSGHRSSPSTCQSSCRKLQSSTDSSQGKAVVHHQDQCPKRWNRLWSSGTTMRNWLCSCSRWGTGRGCWVSVSIGGQGEWMPSDLFLQNALFCE